jgi:hypothetical protein
VAATSGVLFYGVNKIFTRIGKNFPPGAPAMGDQLHFVLTGTFAPTQRMRVHAVGRCYSQMRQGTLHRGSKNGPPVTSQAQAVRIMESEKRKAEEGKEDYKPEEKKKGNKFRRWARKTL